MKFLGLVALVPFMLWIGWSVRGGWQKSDDTGLGLLLGMLGTIIALFIAAGSIVALFVWGGHVWGAW